MRRPTLTAFLAGIVVALALSTVGYWELIFIPMVLLGYVGRGKPLSSLSYLGLAGVVGALISLLANPYAIQDGALTASIMGIPGGAAVPLALTLALAFFDAGLGGAVGAALNEMRRDAAGKK